jgi:hypothetical protein
MSLFLTARHRRALYPRFNPQPIIGQWLRLSAATLHESICDSSRSLQGFCQTMRLLPARRRTLTKEPRLPTPCSLLSRLALRFRDLGGLFGKLPVLMHPSAMKAAPGRFNSRIHAVLRSTGCADSVVAAFLPPLVSSPHHGPNRRSRTCNFRWL